MQVLSAADPEPSEQPNGPPAIAPTPLMIDDHAVPNCTAMKAPEEIPETEVCAISAL
jgi:hypothetical protein